MKIIDKYNVSDREYKPIGIVKIKDKDGKIIVERHNMVVNDGRFIIYTLFRNFFSINDNNEYRNISSGKLKLRISYDNTSSQTTANLDLDTIEKTEFTQTLFSGDVVDSYQEFDISINSDIGGTIGTINPSFDDTNRSITFKTKILDDAINEDYIKFNQIFIYYTYNVGSSNEEQRKLFSRVAMDPVFLTNGQEYNIEYTLYF